MVSGTAYVFPSVTYLPDQGLRGVLGREGKEDATGMIPPRVLARPPGGQGQAGETEQTRGRSQRGRHITLVPETVRFTTPLLDSVACISEPPCRPRSVLVPISNSGSSSRR